MLRIMIYLGIVLGASLPVIADSGPEKLSYMCEDIPPSNYLENGELKGASVEILHMLWTSMGMPPQKVKVVPWARGYHSVQTDSNQVLFSMTRTPEREALFKWVGPIFSVKNVLIGLASRSKEIAELVSARSVRIGLIKDDVAEKNLLDHGFAKQNLDAVSTLEQNFVKLQAGRIDLVAHTESTLQAYIASSRMAPSKFKVYQILSDSPNYFAFSRDVPDEWIARFQTGLDASRRKHDKILARYGLSL